MFSRFIRSRSIAAIAGFLIASGQVSADEVKAIASGGTGDLTMCSYSGCNLYHHVELPPRIALGDAVPVRFGSNPKLYNFPVVRIVNDGAGCTVYSQTATTADVEKIEVASCKAVPAAH